VTAVHQFHPVLAPGDAMSNHVFALRGRLREWGYESQAYALEVKDGVDALPYRRLFRTVRPGDTLILHFSIGSEIFDQLVKLDARRVLVYHNVTPPEFFTGINDHAAAYARLGLRQLERLAPRIDLGVGVSEFNRKDLAQLGFRETAHVPLLIDWGAYDVTPDPAVLARSSASSSSSGACRRTSGTTTSCACSRTTAAAWTPTRTCCSSARTAISPRTTPGFARSLAPSASRTR